VKTENVKNGNKTKAATDLLRRQTDARAVDYQTDSRTYFIWGTLYRGAAIFFAKEPSKVEVINDTNGELMNFYRVIKEKFPKLKREIDLTLHSRDNFRKAMVIYNNPDMFDEVKRAWAVWAICAQAFSSKMNGPWGYDKSKNSTSAKIDIKRSLFTEVYAKRLERVQIECADALYIIQSRDFENAFFYCDPPYFNSNMGHYGGYTEQDFDDLLKLLSQIKGKFLLSSYPSEILERYTRKFKWFNTKRELLVSVNAKGGNPKAKTEMLTANYSLSEINN